MGNRISISRQLTTPDVALHLDAIERAVVLHERSDERGGEGTDSGALKRDDGHEPFVALSFHHAPRDLAADQRSPDDATAAETDRAPKTRCQLVQMGVLVRRHIDPATPPL